MVRPLPVLAYTAPTVTVSREQIEVLASQRQPLAFQPHAAMDPDQDHRPQRLRACRKIEDSEPLSRFLCPQGDKPLHSTVLLHRWDYS
jgi:hypothetical protein